VPYCIDINIQICVYRRMFLMIGLKAKVKMCLVSFFFLFFLK
jgi:hypothetical protein